MHENFTKTALLSSILPPALALAIQEQHRKDKEQRRGRHHKARKPALQVAKQPHDPDDQGNQEEQR